MKNKLVFSIFTGIMLLIGTSALADSDVYITQSGASFTASIVIDGNGNEMGNSTTVFTATGANLTFDIDMLGASNKIDGKFVGAGASGAEDLEVKQQGGSNEATINVGDSAAAADVHISETTTGDSNNTTYNIGSSATTEDVNVTAVLTGDSNILIVNENATGSTASDKTTTVTMIGNSNTPSITHSGSGHHNTVLHHTGASGDFDINQSGQHDTDVHITTNGGGTMDVDVTITE